MIPTVGNGIQEAGKRSSFRAKETLWVEFGDGTQFRASEGALNSVLAPRTVQVVPGGGWRYTCGKCDLTGRSYSQGRHHTPKIAVELIDCECWAGTRLLVPAKIVREAAKFLGEAAQEHPSSMNRKHAALLHEALLRDSVAPGPVPVIDKKAEAECPECARLRGALHELDVDDGRRPPEQRLRPGVWWTSVLAVRELIPPSRALEACARLVTEAAARIEKVAARLEATAKPEAPPLPVHLLYRGGALCGAPPYPRSRAVDVAAWVAMAVRKDGTPFCKACARYYRQEWREKGKTCTRCRGVKPSWDPVTGRGTDRCTQCAGIGSYPEWAAEALEAAGDPLPPVNPEYQEKVSRG